MSDSQGCPLNLCVPMGYQKPLFLRLTIDFFNFGFISVHESYLRIYRNDKMSDIVRMYPVPSQKNDTIFTSFLNNFLDFQKSTFVRGKRLEILSSIILPCGYVRSHKKCGPNRFSRFDVYWTQKHTHIPQTPRKAKYVYRNGLENNLRNLTLKEGSQGSLKTTSTVPLMPENYVCSPVNT